MILQYRTERLEWHPEFPASAIFYSAKAQLYSSILTDKATFPSLLMPVLDKKDPILQEVNDLIWHTHDLSCHKKDIFITYVN